ncbi:alpha/beta hydrolase family protein [Microbacterium murale]|uniref:Alpha-beta hydrolase superfamily lysophospholipase n=1 Tax=Microbacterium murale TaxID=1081040 RepID=A0ABU0PA10_9MICO|nr:alpha/beta fold hydrolase [Microbacterium murale]MDQ0643464.1 alpha-beta hydrolase superfamily lysophospholipase [Microbacterium murale]
MSASPGALFADPFHEEFGTWMWGYTPYGGGGYGEVAAVAAAVGEGDDGAFFDAWVSAGDRLRAEAEESEAMGRRSASDLYLRASAFYASAYHPLFGDPVDPRLLEGFRRQIEAFEAGLALRGVHPVAVEVDEARIPAYLIPAFGREDEVRPLLILVNGYDATVTDSYFASAVAALQRGYHCLVFDGPGQGAVLFEQGVPMRPDWEVVVSAVIDYALTSPIVDPDRIVISGWSLGGYLAPRAASGDSRIAACIADPGQWDLGAGLAGFARQLGATDDEAANLTSLDDAVLDRLMSAIESNRKLRWSIVQRGFWVNGVSDLRSFLAKSAEYRIDDVDAIRCPVLLTQAEGDPIASAVPAFAAALHDVTVVEFTSAEGAGGHCSMRNRSTLNRRVLDWLDDTLGLD